MKTKKYLLIAMLSMILAGCGNGGSTPTPTPEPTPEPTPSEPTPEPTPTPTPTPSVEDILKEALDSVGTNYTVTWSCLIDEDDYSPMKLFGDGYMAQKLMYQLVGYGKVALDNNAYHAFDHYNPDRIDPYQGQYFTLQGRRDFDDDQLKEMANISSFFDLSKFEWIDDNHYRSKDESNIVNYLADINTSFGYYMFGHGHEGVEIVLDDDGKLSSIDWYGIGSEETGEQISAGKWATATYSNIGTTKDDIFLNYVAEEENIPEPSYDDLSIVSKKGKAIYEGTHHTFTDMVVSAPIGNYFALVSGDNPYDGFVSTEYDTLKEFTGTKISFEADINTCNGHVELNNISNVDVIDDPADIEPCWVEDAESYYWDWGDWEYGVRNTGSALNVINACYNGYEKTANAFVLKVSYLYCGVNFSINVTFPSEDVDGLETSWNDFINDNISVGDWINLPQGIFVYENTDATLYIDQEFITSIEKGMSFNDLCKEIVGSTIPLPDGMMGFEFFYDTFFPVSDGVDCPGVFGLVDVYEDQVENYVNNYKDKLTNAGYTQVQDYEDESGIQVVQFNLNNIAILFTSPSNDDGDYYYATLQIVDITDAQGEKE